MKIYRKNSKSIREYLPFLLFVLILLVGAYFRFIGINWDENYHLHPDERFLTMVESSISPVKNLSEYFNTQNSSLNPHNSGFSFFVYGTFPIFLVRYIAGWMTKSDYNHVFLIGRYLSGFFDLLSIVLVYFCAQRLYKNKWLSLIAATFASVCVLSIQLAHFFTVDSIANFFTLLAIYFSICILRIESKPYGKKPNGNTVSILIQEIKNLKYFILFGISLGLAAASKINTIVVAGLLPIAILLNDPVFLFQKNDRKRIVVIRNVVIAAFISFLVFRFFQPYAFTGPRFFNISLNPKWIENLKELNYLSSGDSNFPPSLQWARRPVWFGLENILNWGMGLPLGMAFIFGFIWMGRKILNGEWKSHLLIWLWTTAYFIWQSLRWNPTMRYFQPIYSTAFIVAAWGLVQIWELGKRIIFKKIVINFKWSSYLLITAISVSTLLWAFAFTRIYTRPVTRVSASKWIYENIESAINLSGTSKYGKTIIPLTTSHYFQLIKTNPLTIKFIPETDGLLSGISFDHIVDALNNNEIKRLSISISEFPSGIPSLVDQNYDDVYLRGDDPRGKSYLVNFGNPIPIQKGKSYSFQLKNENDQIPLNLAGNISIVIDGLNTSSTQPIYLSAEVADKSGMVIPFIAPYSTQIDKVILYRAIDWAGSLDQKKLSFTVSDSLNQTEILATATFSDQFSNHNDYRGTDYSIPFEKSINITAGHPYLLKVQLLNDKASLAFYGNQLANESSWDDSIPLAMHGYNPFDNQSGIYQSDLNFEMYWDDNQQKLERFKSILSQADYVYISSNRQWGSINQIPEKYPLTTTYYRDLLGCPIDKDIEWCYRIAEPGMFEGKLGFQLIKVFQSDPNIGNIRFNTQFAEEAFTVYDHPKVLIFRKEASFSRQKNEQSFSKIDLTKVINLTPTKANLTPGTLTMPEGMKEKQYSGGTWAQLFNLDSIVNSNSIFGLVIWYLMITLLGWINYPLVRMSLRGLNDKGFPVLKLSGLLLFALPVWLAGSMGLEVSKTLISNVFLILICINCFIFLKQKKEMENELKEKASYFLKIEMIALFFFLLFILIRLGNPDLWHPYKGGEKPMDFSYFNAILKSSIFPPYDPWYANGYLNYYYFGFVLAAVPVKWLGLTPSVAYNFILPSFFSYTAMGAFSFGWNIRSNFSKQENKISKDSLPNKGKKIISYFSNPYFWGIITAILLLIIGNLGTVRMLFHGFQRLASAGVPIESGNFLQRAFWSVQGFANVLAGQKFNYYPGDWYWIPSRAIPGESITEFPFFTFLYADPHAHLFSLPLTLIVLLWAISVLFMDKEKWKINSNLSLIIIFGSIVVGALRITNTWDFPTYMGICIIVLLFKSLQSASLVFHPFLKGSLFKLNNPADIPRSLLTIAIFIILSLLIYFPFSKWYGQAYNSIEIWNGSLTPISSYLTHWGFFLFITICWWVWEFRNWMADTPLKVVQEWLKYRNLLIFVFGSLLFVFTWLVIRGIEISWIVVPLLLMGLFLLFSKDKSDIHRFLIFLALVGWSLTLLVEIVVLRGDIGRMNTVFKFYLQAWTLISLSSSYFLYQLINAVLKNWNEKWRRIWEVGFILLLIGVFMYPITATIDKITDRMSNDVPVTLDGMDYMKTAKYSTNGASMDLNQDYQGIRWMQMNVKESPVIVEANVPEYQWGNRYTIYTGLPGVIGWNWHQRQQRAILPSNWVTDRIDEVQKFYMTSNTDDASNFIQKYQIKYIIVGQLERIVYPGIGLEKFDNLDGKLWRKVFEIGDTKIYSVIN